MTQVPGGARRGLGGGESSAATALDTGPLSEKSQQGRACASRLALSAPKRPAVTTVLFFFLLLDSALSLLLDYALPHDATKVYMGFIKLETGPGFSSRPSGLARLYYRLTLFASGPGFTLGYSLTTSLRCGALHTAVQAPFIRLSLSTCESRLLSRSKKH